jgi:uncharacterized YccA/Bax inhibitor family protein
MRSSNPALSAKTFRDLTRTDDGTGTMTLAGTVNKTVILLSLLVFAAMYPWSLAAKGSSAVIVWTMGGMFGGLIAAMVTIFKKEWAPASAPVYAILEGLFLGGLSAMIEAKFPGIVIQAVALTFGVLFSLLLAYKSKMIQATENFKLGVAAATGGIFLIYMATFILGFFGLNIPFVHSGGLMGIGFSLFVVVIASLNLVLDFDFIEAGAEQGAPKYMEWYGAFGLMVTLAWLYIEILHLLAKLRGRD